MNGGENKSDVETSPSSRGRGLKWRFLSFIVYIILSPSSRGRGLKCLLLAHLLVFLWSPSSRGRGLK